MGYPCYSVKGPYDPEEMIVFFGWLKGPKISGLSSVNKQKLLAIATVSLTDPPAFGWNKVKDVNGIMCPTYHFLGWIDRKKLYPHEKLLFYVLCAFMKLKGLDDNGKKVFDAMMQGGSFFDEGSMEQLERFCSNH